MSHPRKFRFGLQTFKSPEGQSWSELARRTESQGYSTLFMPDHFDDQLAPLPALAAAAAVTSDLRVGTMVLDNDYKHPVVHAKELATIDVLSEGRLEIGIGAGWMRADYQKSGIAYDRAGARIDRFIEGLAVIRGLFADGPFSYRGEHYTIDGLDGLPKPVQRPNPPVIIGAGGPRMLALAAREADIVSVNPSMQNGVIDASTAGDATPAAYDRKLATLEEAAGARFGDLELSCLLTVVTPTSDRAAVATKVARNFGVTAEDALQVPLTLFGTVDEMCAQLEQRRERWGISYFVCHAGHQDAMAPVIERLAGN